MARVAHAEIRSRNETIESRVDDAANLRSFRFSLQGERIESNTSGWVLERIRRSKMKGKKEGSKSVF